MGSPCLGCNLLREAMPLLGPRAPEVWNASVELGARIHGVDPRELVVVVGSLRAPIPLVEQARGPFHLATLPRAEVLRWAARAPERALVVQGLDTPAPPGRAWTLAAIERCAQPEAERAVSAAGRGCVSTGRTVLRWHRATSPVERAELEAIFARRAA